MDAKSGPRATEQMWTFKKFLPVTPSSKQSPNIGLLFLTSAANHRLFAVGFGDLVCFPLAP